jgi:hypothetical protein
MANLDVVISGGRYNYYRLVDLQIHRAAWSDGLHRYEATGRFRVESDNYHAPEFEAFALRRVSGELRVYRLRPDAAGREVDWPFSPYLERYVAGPELRSNVTRTVYRDVDGQQTIPSTVDVEGCRPVDIDEARKILAAYA